MPDWSIIANHISEATGAPFSEIRHHSVGGGSINAAHVLEGDGKQFFVKLNSANLLDMFEAEAAGLEEMASANAIRVPQPVCHGVSGSEAYLVIEYLSLGGSGNGAKAGEQLAALHQKQQDQFGWYRDNTIGSTPQPNTLCGDWLEFYSRHRLGFQLKLAESNGFHGRLISNGEHLLAELGAFFSDYQPVPSLLHGDLWGGNYATTKDGEPVIFDPAVYYGDREADIAMTELFGGFPRDFYSAYHATWPLDAGYKVRKTLYNLYHIINHANLFGGGYASQAEGMIGSLLSEIR